MTSTNNNVVPTCTSEHTNYFSKGINSDGLSETVRNHRKKYILFKSFSSKYNEVFHYYLYLTKELPVCDNIEAHLFRPQKKQPVTST